MRQFAQSALCIFLALMPLLTWAQAGGQPQDPNALCSELKRNVLTRALQGQFQNAEAAFSVSFAKVATNPERMCAGLVLADLASLLGVSGGANKAEQLTERSLRLLESVSSPHDPVLLRPLHILVNFRLELGKTGRAREAVQRMQAIQTEQPEQCALVHLTVGWLRQAESRFREAKIEYRAALRALDETGREKTTEAVSVLIGLATANIEEQEFEEAKQVLEQARVILSAAQDTVPMDHIALLRVQARLYFKQRDWPHAADDLAMAVSLADHEAYMDSTAYATLLANYAISLRKAHRRRQARAIEARSTTFRAPAQSNAIVDISELFANSKRHKR